MADTRGLWDCDWCGRWFEEVELEEVYDGTESGESDWVCEDCLQQEEEV